jgi:hypothetical protein
MNEQDQKAKAKDAKVCTFLHSYLSSAFSIREKTLDSDPEVDPDPH